MGERRFLDARILIADDEPANLRLLERVLRHAGYTELVFTTESREVASLARTVDPDLVLLDLHMPPPDGFAILEELSPLLRSSYLPVLVLTADVTGAAKQRALSGGAKDFLTKPLDVTEVLLRIHNLLETRFLYREERVLLEQTLQGSIRALTDVLALINPAGFSRALRARDTIRKLLTHLGREPDWEVEVAAMLSQLGAATLPPDTLERHYYGKKLTIVEAAAVSRMPEVASELVRNIPRLGEVARILATHALRFDGAGSPPGVPVGKGICWGARALKLVLDADLMETRGIATRAAMETMRERKGWYDLDLLGALAEMREIELARHRVVEIEVRRIRPGMVLAEDLRTVTDMLLLARGQEVSARVVERLRNAERLLERRQRVHVIASDAP